MSSSTSKQSEQEPAGLSDSWCQPRFLTMQASALVLALGLLCGVFILMWKAWLVYNVDANAVDFKASLLGYTIAHPNITTEVRELWSDCCSFPMSTNPNTSALDDIKGAGRAAFALIFIAVVSGVASLVGAASLAMPPAYKCDCVSARGRCEMITMMIFDLITFFFGFLGFIVYYAQTSDARDKILCFNNDPCIGKASYGQAFALGAFAGACSLIAFALHLSAFCFCSAAAADAEYEYEYADASNESGLYEYAYETSDDEDEYASESESASSSS
ncbi:uncharacterized protein AMSG_02614 [Thecamonas trahens ATCC 50062]|uniref:Uncharacterized protein n=1 Tax=Thecamonas trahens ATCC 50062 TaxID=461836 RepID=A0A0L0D5H7_THETB|nr:hypothetical protein AMSG_02614 [Thecamonas trahens ATCC 50062]KNC47589.1 hypothetical protein AMSG_02614 [Thecamonas trahens ATCC 50062]|eukprot:XP_013759519.1 hypothetical protein AMSG_02614 [Thecamonas trahens ATCC 50062]